MIAFLIFYFVFSAMFVLGNEGYREDNIPAKRIIAIVLLAWLVMPFGLGMLYAKIMDDELTVKVDKDE